MEGGIWENFSKEGMAIESQTICNAGGNRMLMEIKCLEMKFRWRKYVIKAK